ncbi:Hypothetical protein SMAX5B_016484 [Scophthalmus maximus]|uniref:Uncharacterized protein n=1 Tax=Scophthalmus maximus TaxID=52904 RepID=A0A2U9C5Z7_SCOMX|nr:Hypothetical protein SMAX5B_016484 [Scophthalmus maximus]
MSLCQPVTGTSWKSSGPQTCDSQSASSFVVLKEQKQKVQREKIHSRRRDEILFDCEVDATRLRPKLRFVRPRPSWLSFLYNPATSPTSEFGLQSVRGHFKRPGHVKVKILKFEISDEITCVALVQLKVDICLVPSSELRWPREFNSLCNSPMQIDKTQKNTFIQTEAASRTDVVVVN